LIVENCRLLRQSKSRPILEDIQACLEREQPQVLPKSPEGQAIAHLRDIFQRIGSHPENRLADLLPDQRSEVWTVAANARSTS
jgi:hypothetical protein